MSIKTLILVRHAKSSWADSAQPDVLRPLNTRGQRDAPHMARRLAERGVRPDLILSSSAVRALTTAQIFADVLGYPRDRILSELELYLASIEMLRYRIRCLDDAMAQVILVGHNPGFTSLANLFLNQPIDNLPTCGIVESVFEMDSWAVVDSVRPTRTHLDYPRKARDDE